MPLNYTLIYMLHVCIYAGCTAMYEKSSTTDIHRWFHFLPKGWADRNKSLDAAGKAIQVQHEQPGCCGSINGKQLPRGNTRKRQIWSSSSLEIQGNSMNTWSHVCTYVCICIRMGMYISNDNTAYKSNEKLLPCWCCDKPNCLQLQAAPCIRHTLTLDCPFSVLPKWWLADCLRFPFILDSYSHICAHKAHSGRGMVKLIVINVTNAACSMQHFRDCCWKLMKLISLIC